MGRPWYRRFADCVGSKDCRRRKWAGTKRATSKGTGWVSGKIAGTVCTATTLAATQSAKAAGVAGRNCNRAVENTWIANADRDYHKDRLEIRFGDDYHCAPHHRRQLNLSGSVFSERSRREMAQKIRGDANLPCSADKSPSRGGCHCSPRNAVPIVCDGVPTFIPVSRLPSEVTPGTDIERFVDRVFADERLMGYLCVVARSDAATQFETDEAVGGLLGGQFQGFVEDDPEFEPQRAEEALTGFLG